MPDMDPHRAGPSIHDVLTRQDVHRSSLLWDAPLAGEEVPGVLTCRHQDKGLLEELGRLTLDDACTAGNTSEPAVGRGRQAGRRQRQGGRQSSQRAHI
nr:hypothetical protein CFP56_66619 [Quercus suber]